eukprot:748049_1
MSWVLLFCWVYSYTGHGLLYENPGPITPAVNSADLTAIPIRDCMRYKLDVVINAWCTHGSNWCAIMHVGNDDDISKQALQRMPSLSLLRYPCSKLGRFDGHTDQRLHEIQIRCGDQCVV